MCTASQGFVQLLPASEFTLVSLRHIFSGVKSPDPWVHHFLIFLATSRKLCLSSKLNPLLQSTPNSEELAQVPSLGRLRSQEAAAAHWVHQCQRYCLHSNAGLFVFLMNSLKEQKKHTWSCRISCVIPPFLSVLESTRDSTSGLAGLGLNIPGGRMRASEVYKREGEA